MTRPDTDDERSTIDAATLPAPTLPSDGTRDVTSLEAPVLREMDFRARYAEVASLGEGGMGVVTLHADRQIGRRVAMKRLLPHRDKAGEANARFVHEARVQGQLEHPAVVPVYDIGIDPDGSVYFTMKRIHGTTLADIINRLRASGDQPHFSRRRLLTAFCSVCLAVDFAHQKGVVHRDLKPANLMLGDYGEVYVLDWGLARVRGQVDPGPEPALELAEKLPISATIPGSLLGTLGYMSPEQLRGEHDTLGPPSDIYSLGAILFEILTLEPLHPGDTPQEIFDSNLRGAGTRPCARAPDRDVPPELEAIVVKATTADPRARFQSARDLNAAIERYLDGERDGELRRQMAQRHTLAAAEAVDRARTEDSPQFEERRRAMREIGRALALDPGNEQAMSLMVRLLGEPPRCLPGEVAIEMERVERGSLRWMGRIGGFAYASPLLFLPFFLWSGVRDWTWPCIFYGSALLASAVSFWVASRRRPPRHIVLAVVLFSNIAFASTAALFGPFIVAPALLAINAAAFALNLNIMHRHIAVAAGCVFVLLAIAGGLFGAIPGTYSFDGHTMTLSAGAIHLPRMPSLVFLTAIAVASILTGAMSVTRVRDKLALAERQLYLYAWHLRELLPEAVRAPTDPTVARIPTYRRA